jgi:hypothetical protein
MRVPVSSLNPTFDDTVKVGFWRWLTSTKQERRMWRWLRDRAAETARDNQRRRLAEHIDQTINLRPDYTGRRRAQ